MAVQEKVSAVGFVVETGLDAEGIRAAGRRSLESGKRFMTNTVTEGRGTATSQEYVIKGPGNIVKQMVLHLSWEQADQGRARVALSVGDYMTTRPVVLFIPVGPKSAPALTSARNFADALRQELGAS